MTNRLSPTERLPGRRVRQWCALGLLLSGLLTSASAEVPPLVQSTLDRFDLSAEALSVVVRDLETGVDVLRHEPDVSRNPASVMKLVTTYAALGSLSPGYTWDTEVHLLGELDGDGNLNGDLLLRGGGDPYLVESQFLELLTELRRRGVQHINGDLLLDDTFFDVASHDPGEFDNEPLRAYNVGPNALLTNFKVVRFWFEPDLERRQVRVTTLPALPNLKVTNELKLISGRCRGYQRGIEIDASPRGDAVRFHGTFPDGCKRYSMGRSLLTHAGYLEGLFREQWGMLGGGFSGTVRRGLAPEESEPMMIWPSRQFGEVIRLINKHSNNVMTRQVFLTMGADTYGAPATIDKARESVGTWLADQGLPHDAFVIDNGAGLSREARATASALSDLLVHAWNSPQMPEFMSSLALAGTDGTFRRRHRRGPLTGRAHLKTGRLDHVAAMAGYVMAADGRRYTIAVLHNETDVHRGGGEAVQDALLRWLYAYESSDRGPILTEREQRDTTPASGSD